MNFCKCTLWIYIVLDVEIATSKHLAEERKGTCQEAGVYKFPKDRQSL